MNPDNEHDKDAYELFKNIQDLEKYQRLSKEIEGYIKTVLDTVANDVVYIIGIEAKGQRLLYDFFDKHLPLKRYQLISSDKLETARFMGSGVLIFDDQINTGKQMIEMINDVVEHKPKLVRVATLYTNEPANIEVEKTLARSNLKEELMSVTVRSCPGRNHSLIMLLNMKTMIRISLRCSMGLLKRSVATIPL